MMKMTSAAKSKMVICTLGRMNTLRHRRDSGFLLLRRPRLL
jgi:hypothetical protein